MHVYLTDYSFCIILFSYYSQFTLLCVYCVFYTLFSPIRYICSYQFECLYTNFNFKHFIHFGGKAFDGHHDKIKIPKRTLAC